MPVRNPGEWGPSSRTLRNLRGSVRVLQPVRSSTHAPAGMRPCAVSQDWTRSGVSRKSGLACTSARHVDDASGADEFARRDRVGRILGQILAGDPVDRRVEVRARVFAEGQDVPVPGRPTVIVARDLGERQPRRRREDRRQIDHRRLGAEWRGEVHDANPPCVQLFHQLG